MKLPFTSSCRLPINNSAIARYLVEADGYWTDAETALDGFATMPYRNQKVPEQFSRTLIANYGTNIVLEAKLRASG